jgi:biopolymer transport protein TolR
MITKVNVTPIIDVALVLVIILLVTAPLISVADLPVNLPQAHTREAEDQKNVSITLGSGGELAVDDRIVAETELAAALSAAPGRPGIERARRRARRRGRAVGPRARAARPGARAPARSAWPSPRARRWSHAVTTLAAELSGIRTRTGWCMAGSFGAHLLLLLVVMLLPRALPKAPALTEFTLLEPGDLAAGGEGRGAERAGGGDRCGRPRDARAGRELPPRGDAGGPVARAAERGRIVRSPQRAVGDAAGRIGGKVTGVAEARAPVAWPTAATVPASAAGGAGGPSVRLTRGGALGSEPALALTRGGGGRAIAPATAGLDPAAQRAREGAAPRDRVRGRRAARALGRNDGWPIANRPVLETRKPLYPDWAKHDMVEGSSRSTSSCGPTAR